ncbi:uncharacterized protein LOC119576445 [Penaeus monodon]|uniref:uncharacterized protein LOC119576445 n=1 Tax=Penaeus monodon TaxID=6687 RepID=UPI0018A6FCE4|nr:uncharacterized protein LOC119576445 [Penaeus monodon]XP_037780086.1 uncharacterized protein LOC119576445 [Penaeus monodon]
MAASARPQWWLWRVALAAAAASLCFAVIPEGDSPARALPSAARGAGAAGAASSCPSACQCRPPREVVCRAAAGDEQPPLPPRDTESLVLEGYASVPAHLLSRLPRLRHLQVSHGRLHSLDLPPLPQLQTLDVSHSGVMTLSGSELGARVPALVQLNASHSRLTELGAADLQGLRRLRVLDLRGNPLHRVARAALHGLHALAHLDISGSQVVALHSQWLRDAPALRLLNVSRARVSELPRLHGRSLAVVDASHNFLTELPDALVASAGVEELFLHHNPLRQVHLAALEQAAALRSLDLSHTAVVNIDEFVFAQMPRLQHLSLADNARLERVEHGAFTGLHGLRSLSLANSPSLREVEEVAFAGLPNLQLLDLRNSGLAVLPLSLRRVANHSAVQLAGTRLRCDCHHHWLPQVLLHSDVSRWSGVAPLQCTDGTARSAAQLAAHLEGLACRAPTAAEAPSPWRRVRGDRSALLECNVTAHPPAAILWLSASKQVFRHRGSSGESEGWLSHQLRGLEAAAVTSDPHMEVLPSGHLLIRNVSRADVGRYKCFAYNSVSNTSVVVFLGLDDQPLRNLYTESLLFGFACATLFLLVTLLVQLINYLMDRLGWQCCWSCCCCKDRLSPKARQIRKLLESVESYKSQQLERLRENYNAQVVSIKESCYLQMERIRESYGGQTKHLKDLRDYSTQGLTTVKDQYLEQLNNIRDYSVSQMNRVRENYVFQRHRIRKFSAHQLLRLRETYKYQQKTLNKILENLPDLYLQNCRTGGCQRTDSILFDDALNGIDAYYKVDFFDTQSHGSDYYTPASTLTRSFRSSKGQDNKRHSRNSSNTSCDFVEAQPWIRRDSLSVAGSSPAHSHPPPVSVRSHNRSLSVATPTSYAPDPVRVHKRSLSATHPYHRVAPAPEGRGVPARITLREEASDYDLATPPTSPSSLPSTPTSVARQRPAIAEAAPRAQRQSPPLEAAKEASERGAAGAGEGCSRPAPGEAERPREEHDQDEELLVAVVDDSASNASTAYETSL